MPHLPFTFRQGGDGGSDDPAAVILLKAIVGIRIVAGKPLAVIGISIIQAFRSRSMGLGQCSTKDEQRQFKCGGHFLVGGGAAQLAFKAGVDLSPLQHSARVQDDAALDKVVQRITAKLEADPMLESLKGQVRFVKTHDGMRIRMVERANFSMFSLGTSAPTLAAGELVQTAAHAIEDMPNAQTVSGHTDALCFNCRDRASK